VYYVYDSHLGDAYVSSFECDDDDLYCEKCGDYDRLLDSFETEEEARDFAEKYNNGEIED